MIFTSISPSTMCDINISNMSSPISCKTSHAYDCLVATVYRPQFISHSELAEDRTVGGWRCVHLRVTTLSFPGPGFQGFSSKVPCLSPTHHTSQGTDMYTQKMGQEQLTYTSAKYTKR